MSFVFDTRRESPVMSKATLVPLLLFMASLLPGQDGVLDELAAEDPCSIRVFSAVKTYQPGISSRLVYWWNQMPAGTATGTHRAMAEIPRKRSGIYPRGGR